MENNGGEKVFVYSADQKPAVAPLAPAQPVAAPTPAPPAPQLATPTIPPPAAQATAQQSPATQMSGEGIQWQASEFIDHQKSALWFIALVGVAILASIIIYFLTRGILAPIVVIMAALAFGTIARQKPRSLQYALSSADITVGQKKFSYDDFKAFSVVQDGALFSVVLEPTKRFMPPLTIYFAGEDGEKIFDTLAQHLPHEDKQLDAVDRMMRKIRF